MYYVSYYIAYRTCYNNDIPYGVVIESLFGMYNAHGIYNIWYKRLNTFAKNFLFSKRKSTYSNRAETLRMCVPCVYYNTTTRTRIHRLRKMFTRKNGVEINILFSENIT